MSRRRPYGLRARLAWHGRRVLGKPVTVTAPFPNVDPDFWRGFFTAVVDPRPPWRKPAEPDWTGWVHIGATVDDGGAYDPLRDFTDRMLDL